MQFAGRKVMSANWRAMGSDTYQLGALDSLLDGRGVPTTEAA
jgi:hypothetical protein